MPSLGEIQDRFSVALLAPDPELPPTVRGRRDEAPVRRFDVYRNNVAVSLVDALEATFPAVLSLVGREFFRTAGREFIRHAPPRSPVLIDYGSEFASFLDEFPAAQTVPYLGDVARLEWAWNRAYHAAEAMPVGIDALGAIDPMQVGERKFAFHPSGRLLRSPHPVVSLWAANTGQGRHEDVDLTRAEDALVVRPQAEVVVRRLPPGGLEFMRALADDATLAQAAELAAGEVADFDLAEHIGGLFQTGVVVAVLPPAAVAG